LNFIFSPDETACSGLSDSLSFVISLYNFVLKLYTGDLMPGPQYLNKFTPLIQIQNQLNQAHEILSSHKTFKNYSIEIKGTPIFDANGSLTSFFYSSGQHVNGKYLSQNIPMKKIFDLIDAFASNHNYKIGISLEAYSNYHHQDIIITIEKNENSQNNVLKGTIPVKTK
jgi:hypothetical protein